MRRFAGLGKRRQASGSSFKTNFNINHAAGLESGFILMLSHAMLPSGGAGHGIFANGRSDGGDLRAWLGSTALPLNLFHWDKAGEEMIAWVRVPSALAEDDDVTLEVANGLTAQPADGASLGTNEVYQDEEFATHNFASGLDLTGGYTITTTGALAKAASGLVGLGGSGACGFGSVDGTGASDRSTSDYAGNPTLFTWRMNRLRRGDGGGGFGRIISKASAVEFQTRSDVAQNDYVRSFTGGTRSSRVTKPATGSWAYHSIKHDMTASDPPTHRKDGANDAVLNGADWTLPTPLTGPISNANAYFFGNRSDLARNYDGMIGELRIRHALLSDAWLDAEAANVIDPAAFATADAGGFV